MRIALTQLELSASVEESLDAVKATITQATQGNADLVVLPEATMKAFNSGRLDVVAESNSDRFVAEVSQAARDAGTSVVVGMFRPADQVERDGKTMHRVFNSLSLAWRDEDGPGVEFYDKLHLFDAFGFRESDTVAPDSAHVVCNVPLADESSVALGPATCSDIEFPEQFIQLANLGAEVIALPASWNDSPGKVLQWQMLVSARALDSTCATAAADAARPGGAKAAGRDEGPTGAGYSMLVDADGGVIASAGYGPQLFVADVGIAEVGRVHRSILALEIRD